MLNIGDDNDEMKQQVKQELIIATIYVFYFSDDFTRDMQVIINLRDW